MTRPTRFAFDLDGTVTTAEILPAIAKEVGLFPELSLLTRLTMEGAIDFATSFTLRFNLLRHIPLATVHNVVAAIPLDPHIEAFITANPSACALVTGNLDRWIEPITRRLGCAVYCSRSSLEGDELRLTAIVDKGKAVRHMARKGARVIAVGDAANDIPMFAAADVAVLYTGVREPIPSVLREADFAERDPRALCALLTRI